MVVMRGRGSSSVRRVPHCRWRGRRGGARVLLHPRRRRRRHGSQRGRVGGRVHLKGGGKHYFHSIKASMKVGEWTWWDVIKRDIFMWMMPHRQILCVVDTQRMARSVRTQLKNRTCFNRFLGQTCIKCGKGISFMLLFIWRNDGYAHLGAWKSVGDTSLGPRVIDPAFVGNLIAIKL